MAISVSSPNRRAANSITPPLGAAHANRAGMFALGLVMVAIAAIGIAILFSLAIIDVWYVGVLLLLAGVFHAVVAAGCRGWAGVYWLIAVAVVYSIGGLMIVLDPTLDSGNTRYVVAGVLLGAGLVRAAVTWPFRGRPGWRWVRLAGLAALPLGLTFLFGGPLSSLFGVALLLSVEILLQGASCLAIVATAGKQTDAIRA